MIHDTWGHSGTLCQIDKGDASSSYWGHQAGSPRAGVKGTVKTGQRPLDQWLWTERAVLFRYGRNKHSVWNQKFWVDGGRQSNGRKDGEKFWIPSWRQGIYGELWTISMGKLQALLMGNLADQGDCRWGESLQRQIGVILIWSNKPWNLVEGMGMRK